MSMPNVLIMAGGTGGHVFPALAVANTLRDMGAVVSWIGTANGIEAKVVPDAGIKLNIINIAGLRGKGNLSLILAPFKLVWALMQSIQVILKDKPAVVLGMGGYVTGPGGVAAWLMRKPLIIHEQNAIPGLTNKLLSRISTRLFEAFPASFDKHSDAICVGNPVRKEIVDIVKPDMRLQNHDGALRVLVIGGSLGAKTLNTVLPNVFSKLVTKRHIDIIHQAGINGVDNANEAYRQNDVKASVKAFIDDMAFVYSWADIVICRSGAMTISEIAAAGIPSVLIPYPYAVDDHQAANAAFLVNENAAIMIRENQLDTVDSIDRIDTLFSDKVRLQLMSKNARAVARTSAAKQVADACLEVSGV